MSQSSRDSSSDEETGPRDKGKQKEKQGTRKKKLVRSRSPSLEEESLSEDEMRQLLRHTQRRLAQRDEQRAAARQGGNSSSSSSSHGLDLRQRLQHVVEHGRQMALQPGESLVEIPNFPPVRREQDAAGNPTNVEIIPRADGVVWQRVGTGDLKLPVGQTAYGHQWSEPLFERASILERHPMYIFSELTAGASNADVYEMWDTGTLRYATTYDQESKAYREAERKRIMVSASEKDKQITELNERLKERQQRLSNLATATTTLNALLGDAAFLGSRVARFGPTHDGPYASVVLASAFVAQRDELAQLAVRTRASLQNLQPSAPFPGAGELVDAIQRLVIAPSDNLLRNAVVDQAGLVDALKKDVTTVTAAIGNERPVSAGTCSDLLRHTEWLLFLRDAAFRGQTYFRAEAVYRTEHSAVTSKTATATVSVDWLIENTLNAAALLSDTVATASKDVNTKLMERAKILYNALAEEEKAGYTNADMFKLLFEQADTGVNDFDSFSSAAASPSVDMTQYVDPNTKRDGAISESKRNTLLKANDPYLGVADPVATAAVTELKLHLDRAADGVESASSVDWLLSYLAHLAPGTVTDSSKLEEGIPKALTTLAEVLVDYLKESWSDAPPNPLNFPLVAKVTWVNVSRTDDRRHTHVVPPPAIPGFSYLAAVAVGAACLASKPSQLDCQVVQSAPPNQQKTITIELIEPTQIDFLSSLMRIVDDTAWGSLANAKGVTIVITLDLVDTTLATQQLFAAQVPNSNALPAAAAIPPTNQLSFLLFWLKQLPRGWFNGALAYNTIAKHHKAEFARGEFSYLETQTVTKDAADNYLREIEYVTAGIPTFGGLYGIRHLQRKLVQHILPQMLTETVAWVLLAGRLTRILQLPQQQQMDQFLADFVVYQWGDDAGWFSLDAQRLQSLRNRGSGTFNTAEKRLASLQRALGVNTSLSLRDIQVDAHLFADVRQDMTRRVGVTFRDRFQVQQPALYVMAILFGVRSRIPEDVTAALSQEVQQLDEALQKARKDQARIVAGEAGAFGSQVEAVRALYVASPAWEMRPEIAGKFRLSAELVHAMEEGLSIVRAHVPALAACDLDDLTQGPVASGLPGAFARLCSALMNEHRLAHPRQYNKDVQYKRSPKLRLDAVNALRQFESSGHGARQIVRRRDADGSMRVFRK